MGGQFTRKHHWGKSMASFSLPVSFANLWSGYVKPRETNSGDQNDETADELSSVCPDVVDGWCVRSVPVLSHLSRYWLRRAAGSIQPNTSPLSQPTIHFV
jgi:hypothetical protein|tara:strand:- start:6764 stop:7063 length:300 start_codon:yes stop_codon:yes gene_type:complete